MMHIEESPAPPPSPRIVLLSIAAFWALYFALWSLRGAVIYSGEHSMFVARALVSFASAGVTLVFYLLMRRVPAMRLGRAMAIAALLAAPAAIAYSTINWFVFDHLTEHQPMHWNWKPPLRPPAPALPATTPPSPPAGVSVGKMMSDEDETPLMSIADQAGNGYFFFVAWAAIYLSLCYAARMGALERRAAELRAAAQSAELRALRYQVNPHFLFNTLNSLSSLVMIGKTEEAERMIINLSTFFRSSLTGDPTEDVPLSEEILLQRLYLDIETVRFPERLIVTTNVPEALGNVCVPGLILQPLVENAVKYGVSRARRPVTIRIRAEDDNGILALTVEDDGDPIGTGLMEGGTGVGLRNVRERLEARFGEAAHCSWNTKSEGGFVARLTMPLVRDGC